MVLESVTIATFCETGPVPASTLIEKPNIPASVPLLYTKLTDPFVVVPVEAPTMLPLALEFDGILMVIVSPFELVTTFPAVSTKYTVIDNWVPESVITNFR